jgi:hypothetical protein
VELTELKVVQHAPEIMHDPAVQPAIVFVTGLVDHVEVTADKPRSLRRGAYIPNLLQEGCFISPDYWAVGIICGDFNMIVVPNFAQIIYMFAKCQLFHITVKKNKKKCDGIITEQRPSP